MLIKLPFICKNSNPSKLKEMIKNHIILKLAESESSTTVHYCPTPF